MGYKYISTNDLNNLIDTEILQRGYHIGAGPANDLNQAWEAAEKAGKYPCVFKDINGYCAKFAYPDDASSEWELSPAIALCVAALAAKGIRVKVASHPFTQPELVDTDDNNTRLRKAEPLCRELLVFCVSNDACHMKGGEIKSLCRFMFGEDVVNAALRNLGVSGY